MLKSKKRSDAIIGIALLIAITTAGCGGKEAEAQAEMSKSEKEAAASSAQANFGDAVLTPAIELDGWTALIAYQREAHGYPDTEGAEATILRAGAPGIERLEESERRLGGERIIGEFTGSRILSDFVFARKSGGAVESRYMTVSDEGGAITVEGDGGRYRYSRTAEGGIRIESSRRGSLQVEEYRPDGSSRLSRDGLVIAEGGTRVTKYGFEYFEREPGDVDGNSELFYTLELLGPDRYLSEIGSVEPLAWVLVEGLATIRGGATPLRDIAVLDRLMGTDRRVTPLLILAYFGKLPPAGT